MSEASVIDLVPKITATFADEEEAVNWAIDLLREHGFSITAPAGSEARCTVGEQQKRDWAIRNADKVREANRQWRLFNERRVRLQARDRMRRFRARIKRARQ